MSEIWAFDRSEKLFTDFMESTIGFKEDIEENNKQISKLFKFALNSSYGVFAQKEIPEQSRTCRNMKEMLEIFACYNVVDIQDIDGDNIDITYDNPKKDHTNPFINVPIGSAIVNYAKQYVDELISKIHGKIDFCFSYFLIRL